MEKLVSPLDIAMSLFIIIYKSISWQQIGKLKKKVSLPQIV